MFLTLWPIEGSIYFRHGVSAINSEHFVWSSWFYNGSAGLKSVVKAFMQ